MNCLCLTLRNASKDLETLLAFVEENARGAGMDEERINRVALVLEEATVNVINHAYGGQGGVLELCCRPVPGGLEIELVDEGPFFDPLQAPRVHAVTDIASLRIGGMGVHLIRSLTDALRYRREGRRNVLTLFFQRRKGTDS